MRPYARLSGVTTGPLGERIIALAERYYPKTNQIYVTSGTDGDHGSGSHHYGSFYAGSPTAAIDFGAYDDPESDVKDQVDMGEFADWLFENFWDLTVELIHYQPHNDHVTMVRNQQKVSGYGDATDQAHINHVHWATSEFLMSLIELRARQLWGNGGTTPPPVTPPSGDSVLFGYDGSDFTHVMNFSGLSFVTHKATEAAEDGTYYHTKLKSVMEAARDQGVPFLGAYVVPRSGFPTAINEAWIAVNFLNEQVPWLLQHPGFFWQVDLEHWPYDAVSSQTGDELADALMELTSKPVVIYASQGQYGDTVVTDGRPLWNANYNRSGASRPFKEMYLGDAAPGWVQYSGQMPLLLQYCSDAVFADGNVGDANAFRGTEDDFRRLILSQSPQGDEDMASSDEILALLKSIQLEQDYMKWRVESLHNGHPATVGPGPHGGEVNALKAQLDKIEASINAGISLDELKAVLNAAKLRVE